MSNEDADRETRRWVITQLAIRKSADARPDDAEGPRWRAFEAVR